MPRKYFAASAEESAAPLPGCSAGLVNMEWVMQKLTRILRCERGANAIEYALVAALISIAALAAFQGLGAKISTMYTNVSNKMV